VKTALYLSRRHTVHARSTLEDANVWLAYKQTAAHLDKPLRGLSASSVKSLVAWRARRGGARRLAVEPRSHVVHCDLAAAVAAAAAAVTTVRLSRNGYTTRMTSLLTSRFLWVCVCVCGWVCVRRHALVSSFELSVETTWYLAARRRRHWTACDKRAAACPSPPKSTGPNYQTVAQNGR